MISEVVIFGCMLIQGFCAEYVYKNEIPKENIKFDKVIGLRPSDSENYRPLIESPNPPLNHPPNGITLSCLEKCRLDDLCTSVVLFYNDSKCFEYVHRYNTGVIYSDDIGNINYIVDDNAAFYVKTSFNVPNSCVSKLWPIERVPGSQLLTTKATKIVNGLYTRQQCAQYCMDEAAFTCRSANFKIKGHVLDIASNNVTNKLGLCALNDADRHTLPNSFRLSNYGDEYIENQCVNISAEENYCSYEEYKDHFLAHIDVDLPDLTKDQCRRHCEEEFRFNCHGFSLIPTNQDFQSNQITSNDTKYLCLLHSEDTQLRGPKLLSPMLNARYFERARCLNLSVNCTSSEMHIKYSPELQFNGRMYMYGFSEAAGCSVYGKGNTTITLSISLEQPSCGVMEAKSYGGENRTLLGGFLIIQYNPLIQTQGDRFVRVGCLLDSGLDVTVENITVGATVKFNSSFPDQGFVIINNSTVNPIVRIYIVDPVTNAETTSVKIGQELQLRIEIEPPDGPYDIWAGHLVAMTENGQESILLLDDRGCPVDSTIFPALTKISTLEKKVLYANFLAFKFTTSPLVKFSVIIHFCTLTCIPNECPGNNTARQLQKRDLPTFDNAKNVQVFKLGMTTTANVTETSSPTMPLEYVIIVYDEHISPDRLIYGNGSKILVAGYDLIRNEVCLDYSLFIGILVTWVLIQLIIFISCIMVVRRYKKYYDIAYDRQSLSDIHRNFGFGSSNLDRRVHWADQNTCPQCPHMIIE